MTTREILAETAAAYRNPANRSKIDKTYPYVTVDGRMNAVGRCMINPHHATDSGLLYMYDVVRTVVKDGKKVQVHVVLPPIPNTMPFNDLVLHPHYRGHEHRFWRDLEHFHDHDAHFTQTGVSSEGEQYLNELRSKWT